MDEAVRRWRQRGCIFFWFEADKGQGLGWHLAADAMGCASLAELADLALSAQYPSRFVITPTLGKGSNPKAVSQLKLAHDFSWPCDVWRIIKQEDRIVLELGAQRIEELRAILPKLAQGFFNDVIFPPDVPIGDAIWI